MKKPSTSSSKAITGLSVAGYKSLYREQSIEIRPLTLLAGANSSGKSSIMQPLLLWKQTLEATYDPGALLLNGPNVRFTSFEQLVPQPERKRPVKELRMGIRLGRDAWLRARYIQQRGEGVSLAELSFDGEEQLVLRTSAGSEELSRIFRHLPIGKGTISLVQERCFFALRYVGPEESETVSEDPGDLGWQWLHIPVGPVHQVAIRRVVHLSGLRGSPARTYPVTAVGNMVPGAFDAYMAGIILSWQKRRSGKLAALSKAAQKLGLTSKVRAVRIDDTQVELQVGRTLRDTKSRQRDLVSLADVGYGVSQTLPVLVALLVAEPGQLVYIEQPELHLHPRAQTALAEVLAEAALRGVQVVAETHSSLLLLGVQTLVAEGKLPSELVKLHWFERDSRGETTIRSADLDEAGAFGEDWPEDFAEVAMQAESRYLDAAEARQRPH